MRIECLLLLSVLFSILSPSESRTFYVANALLPVFRQAKRLVSELEDWRLIGPAPKGDNHTVVFIVANNANSPSVCDAASNEASQPGNPSYGQYMTYQQVQQTFSNQESSKRVENWLKRNEMPYEKNGDFIKVIAPIDLLQRVLKTSFFQFAAPILRKTIFRTESYTLPSEIEDDIDYITNTISFPAIHGKVFAKAFEGHKRKAEMTTPSLINSLYNVFTNIVQSSLSTQSIFGAIGQNYSPEDLKLFQQTYNLMDSPVNFDLGKNDPSACTKNADNCIEANLDVQYVLAVAQKSPTTFWSIAPDSQDPFFEWIISLAQTLNPPLVHSISYGSLEMLEPSGAIQRFSLEACKLGLRGVTIVVASGDDGVPGYSARNNITRCGFNPEFPASCPYVLSVGATQGPEAGTQEIAQSSDAGGDITTGGGFSNVFPTPSWQESATGAYLINTPAPSNTFNPKGRGYPDVAALGHNYVTVIAGQKILLSGTSASAPVVAGMITLINGMRLSVGKSPVGFVNPALYKLASLSTASPFNDILRGKNNCAAGEQGKSVCCPLGFQCSKGWDPLTGLGSPNFVALSSLLVSL